jgi:V/A-type H+-transporting ATPase subunit A
MNGRIVGISGPTVTVHLPGARLYDMVQVGDALLAGEVVELSRDRAVVQVYEDTRGLSINEPVKGLGRPLAVCLGPGLLSGMFDGLQRPLETMQKQCGPFMCGGKDFFPLNLASRWQFTPALQRGDLVEPGSLLGSVDERGVQHLIFSRVSGTIDRLVHGEIVLGSALGVLADGREIPAWCEWPVRKPRPYGKKLPPMVPLVTGIRTIDFLFPLPRGGTAIFPGGFGTGKTILEQGIAKFADVDLVVYVGCGERGNEMAELLEEFVTLNDTWSGRSLMERTIVVVNTSNMPVAAREASIYTAVTMAEYYRDMGLHVLLLADSISRWAESLREISASLEEMPGEEGYPTYLSSRLSSFMERAGVVETLDGRCGSLSMILSVSPPGGDFTEPVTQSCLRTAGAFLMLDTSLAHRRHFPAINWFQSYSLHEPDMVRHFNGLISNEWGELQRRCRDMLLREESLREVAEIVGLEGLQDGDRLLMKTAERIRQDFLSQNTYTDDAFSPPAETLRRIKEIITDHDTAQSRLNEGELLDDMFRTGF